MTLCLKWVPARANQPEGQERTGSPILAWRTRTPGLVIHHVIDEGAKGWLVSLEHLGVNVMPITLPTQQDAGLAAEELGALTDWTTGAEELRERLDPLEVQRILHKHQRVHEVPYP